MEAVNAFVATLEIRGWAAAIFYAAAGVQCIASLISIFGRGRQ